MRGSQFRGVSKNGKKWQVTIVNNKSKLYVGMIAGEQAAARIYDKYAIIFNGFKVRRGRARAPVIFSVSWLRVRTLTTLSFR